MLTILRAHRLKVVLATLTVCGAGFVGLANVLPPGAGPGGNPDRWDWMEGTTWYVRPQGLPAMIYDTTTDAVTPFADQTVYTISRCERGYFVADCTLQYGDNPVQCRKVLGTVTPEGLVILTFIQVHPLTGATMNSATGTGVMRRVQGKWTMENQMCNQLATNPNQFVQHWAYMYQVEEGDLAWDNLPSVNMSVPEFMSQCE